MFDSWKKYFEDLYNVDREEQVTVNIHVVLKGAKKFNYFEGASAKK